MDILEKLKPICSTDPTRHNLATPFMMDWNGRRWAVGTNGHGLAMAHFDGELRTDGQNLVATAGVLPGPPSAYVADVATLRAWIGEVSPAQVECPDCKGKPPPPCNKCEGRGEVDADCDCPDCSGSHPCPVCRNRRDARGGCRGCDSTGKIAAPVRAGQIGKAKLNLNLLSWIFVSAPQEGQIEIAGCDVDDRPVHFRGAGWMGIAMPLRYVDGTVKDIGALQPIASEKVG